MQARNHCLLFIAYLLNPPNLFFVHEILWFIDFICTKSRFICILCKITFLYFHMRFGDTNVGWIYIGILTTNVHKIKIKQVKLLLKLEPKFCRKLKYMCTKRNAFTLLQSIVTSLREKWTSTSDSNFQTSCEIWGQIIKMYADLYLNIVFFLLIVYLYVDFVFVFRSCNYI